MHAEELKNALSKGQFAAAEELLGNSQESLRIEAFNQAFLPFFKLMIESKLDEAKELHQAFNRKYEETLNLTDYNEHFRGMSTAFLNAKQHPEISLIDLYTQPLPDSEDLFALMDISILMALGVSIGLEEKAVEGKNSSIGLAPEEEIKSTQEESLTSQSPPSEIPKVEIAQEKRKTEKVAKAAPDAESHKKRPTHWLWPIAALLVTAGCIVWALRRK